MAFILASSGITNSPTIYFLAGLSVVYYVLFLVLAIALLISPLMIWKWTKKTCKEVEELRSQLSLAEATNIKYLKSINNHLDRIDKIASAAFVDEEGS